MVSKNILIFVSFKINKINSIFTQNRIENFGSLKMLAKGFGLVSVHNFFYVLANKNFSVTSNS